MPASVPKKSVQTNTPSQSSVYHRFAHFYDSTFARVFSPRVNNTIRSLEIPPGASVLEVGVGTGTSLEAYPPHATVVATDLSDDMLNQAAAKADRHGWKHISLQRMDGQDLQFADEQFDYVMAFHVVSVVPDARRMVREMLRVCKPGGRIVIINHFRSPRRWLAALIDTLNPVTRLLGWHTDLRCAELVRDMPIVVEKRYKTSPTSLFTVVLAVKADAGDGNVGTPPQDHQAADVIS